MAGITDYKYFEGKRYKGISASTGTKAEATRYSKKWKERRGGFTRIVKVRKIGEKGYVHIMYARGYR